MVAVHPSFRGCYPYTCTRPRPLQLFGIENGMENARPGQGYWSFRVSRVEKMIVWTWPDGTARNGIDRARSKMGHNFFCFGYRFLFLCYWVCCKYNLGHTIIWISFANGIVPENNKKKKMYSQWPLFNWSVLLSWPILPKKMTEIIKK